MILNAFLWLLFTGLNLQSKIKIEPGLFEWTGHTSVVPRWISPDDLSKQGYPIDSHYSPQVPKDKLEDGESISNLYARSTETTRQILKLHEKEGQYTFALFKTRISRV